MTTPKQSGKVAPRYVAVFLQNKPYLGNQIALIPFFHYLKELYPAHGIVVYAHDSALSALKTMGYIDGCLALPSFGKKLTFPAATRALRSYDIVAAYTFRRHSVKTGLLARLASRRQVIGFAARTTNLFLSQAVPFDINSYAAENALALIDRHLTDFTADVLRKPGDYFLVIPGGSLALKKYPLHRYIQMAEKLRNTAPVHFLLGEDMHDEIEKLSQYSNRFSLHVGRSLSEVSMIIKQSAVVIANDCGPAHFAHIFDMPRVLLFASMEKASHWFYQTDQSRLIMSPIEGDVGAIHPNEIIDAVLNLYHK